MSSGRKATVYRFRITLRNSDPAIWRRIETKDVTLEKLHELIQTAMGWTNSQGRNSEFYRVEILNLIKDVLSDLIAGLAATAVIAGLAILVRRAGPEAFQRFADRARHLGWPLLAFIFLVTTLAVALIRGAPWITVAVLSALTAVALVLILVVRFTPVKVRLLDVAITGHAW